MRLAGVNSPGAKSPGMIMLARWSPGAPSLSVCRSTVACVGYWDAALIWTLCRGYCCPRGPGGVRNDLSGFVSWAYGLPSEEGLGDVGDQGGVALAAEHGNLDALCLRRPR